MANRLSKEELHQLYVVEGLDAQTIADREGYSSKWVVYGLLDKYSIRKPKFVIPIARDELYHLYAEELLPAPQIAAMYGYDVTSIYEWMDIYGIPRQYNSPYTIVRKVLTRDVLEELHCNRYLSAAKISQLYDCSAVTVLALIREYDLNPGRDLSRTGRIDCPVSDEEIRHLYEVLGYSIKAIGAIFGYSEALAERWVYEAGCQIRQQYGGRKASADTRRRSTVSGGGFTEVTLRKILRRDNFRCQMPNCDFSDPSGLQVHHIIPCYLDGDDSINNGITLCYNCHRAIKNLEMDYATLFQRIVETNCFANEEGYIGEHPVEDNTDGTYY